MAKVNGVGGIFYKTKDPSAAKEWYAQHLGFETDQWGSAFTFRHHDDPSKTGYLQWSPMSADTDYIPSAQSYMFNFRVDDLEALVKQLKAQNVTICDDIQTFEYGKFVHILDNDGNKIELWEPVDSVFDTLYDK